MKTFTQELDESVLQMSIQKPPGTSIWAQFLGKISFKNMILTFSMALLYAQFLFAEHIKSLPVINLIFY